MRDAIGEQEQWERLQSRLDEYHEWPCDYVFKLIFRTELYYHVTSLVPYREFSSRESAGGNYTSLTYTIPASSSNEIIELYRRMSTVQGVITL